MGIGPFRDLLFLPAPPSASVTTTELYPALPPAWSLFWELLINLAFALVATRLKPRVLALILASIVILDRRVRGVEVVT